jgi:DNA-binding HxlR family transcriptional regulator
MPTREKYDECPYTGDHACAVEAFLDVLGGRWKGMILFHLLPGTRRFGELRRLLPHVTQRMLTNQLRELEKDGIVARKVYAQVPPRVEYTLTPLGQKLSPILAQMAMWGDAYMRRYEAAKKAKAPARP